MENHKDTDENRVVVCWDYGPDQVVLRQPGKDEETILSMAEYAKYQDDHKDDQGLTIIRVIRKEMKPGPGLVNWDDDDQLDDPD